MQTMQPANKIFPAHRLSGRATAYIPYYTAKALTGLYGRLFIYPSGKNPVKEFESALQKMHLNGKALSELMIAVMKKHGIVPLFLNNKRLKLKGCILNINPN